MNLVFRMWSMQGRRRHTIHTRQLVAFQCAVAVSFSEALPLEDGRVKPSLFTPSRRLSNQPGHRAAPIATASSHCALSWQLMHLHRAQAGHRHRLALDRL